MSDPNYTNTKKRRYQYEPDGTDQSPHKLKALSTNNQQQPTLEEQTIVDKPSYSKIAKQVADHYNTRPQFGIEKRQESTIFHLRAFNNWIKSVLIGRHTDRNDKVLDMGCGKGGDLRKWQKVNIRELVGMDIAQVSVEQAQDRYEKMRNPGFKARFYSQDCYGRPLTDTIQPKDYKANIVSLQFCMHYAFETEVKVRQMLQNVSNHLEIGGRFVGTIPDCYWMVKKLRSLKGDQLEWSNSVYKVRFEQKSKYPVFGHKYWFTLKDALDDCPEYLVHFPTFIKLAREYGMELLYRTPSHQYYMETISTPQLNNLKGQNYRNLLFRMNVIDEMGRGPSPDEWEVTGLYLAFAFKKVRHWSSSEPSSL
ncbi:mRNA cap guanine-N7 methyltransferase [Mycoemilia scoparia]|uniref:mRNA cap guanine-N(7) methyltransferase n=1 Tax=Mycoemilia scoparia TaxID=417184 RepID=A0A9W8A1T5_9FUNG|nr:mRNA cap guanine-N7 methyltransferase [Mycoemilia scoparia]